MFGQKQVEMTSGKEQCLAVGDEDGYFLWGFPRVITAKERREEDNNRRSRDRQKRVMLTGNSDRWRRSVLVTVKVLSSQLKVVNW